MTVTTTGRAPPSQRLKTSPYIGLEPYSEEDAPFFFGRERESRIITANLRSSRLTLLYGASGVGKSSVLMAGVVHGLREKVVANATRIRRRTRHEPDAWERAPFAVADFRTWSHPKPLERLVDRIRISVEEALGGEEVDRWDPQTALIETLRTWTARVRTLLVVLDQFEEYFLYHPDEEGDGTFAIEFPRIVNDHSLRINFLISVREDAWAKLDRFKGRIPNLFSNYLRVGYLDLPAARRAIEGPVEEYNKRLEAGKPGFSIEPELVEAVLRDVGAHELSLVQVGEESAPEESAAVGARRHIETPFLQLVMERLWEETLEQDLHDLRKETLEGLGGAHQIVRRHLDESLAELDQNERAIAADVFRFLVTPSKTKIAQRGSDLAYWAKRPEEEVMPVLERLSGYERGRVLRPLPPPPGERGSRYEIFHDVLVEAVLDWRKRYDQEREKEKLAKQLEEEERKKLEEEREQHKERRNRLVWRGSAVLLVLVVALAVMTVIALHERGVARSRALAASSIAQLPTDPELSILLARRAWERGETRQAEEALRRSLGQSPVRAAFRAGRPLDGAILSGDGRFVVAWAADGSVKVWNARTGAAVPARVRRLGRLVAPSPVDLSQHGASLVVAGQRGAAIVSVGGKSPPIELRRPDVNAAVFSAVFSPSGRYVATTSVDGTEVWNARTGKLLQELPDPAVTSVAFNPRNERLLVTTSFPRTARIVDWRTERTRVLESRGEHREHHSKGAPYLASFSPDGRRVVAVTSDREARLWDARTGAFISALKGHSREIVDFDWSDDSRRLVTAGDKTARVFDASSGRRLATLSGHPDFVNTAVFSPDGALVLTTSRDGTARTWDVDSATTLSELRGHAGDVSTGVFASNGRRVLTASADETARVWDVFTGRALRGHRDWVLSAAYSPDGRRVVTAGADGTARIWNLSNGESVPVTGLPAGQIASASFSRDGRSLVLAGDEADGISGRVVTADPASGAGRLLARTRRPGGTNTHAAVSPDGRHVVVTTLNFDAEIRSAEGKREGRLRLPTDGKASDAAYSPDGRRIVTAGYDGIARVFDARTRRQIAAFGGHKGGLASASFSPDGNFVVTAGFDATARVWEATTGDAVAVLRGHTAWVASATFSPDGGRVVTGGADKTSRIWDARSGRILSVEHQHADAVNSVAFSPDGGSILSASDDHTAKIYGCETCGSVGQVLALAQKRVTRDLTRDERESFGEG